MRTPFDLLAIFIVFLTQRHMRRQFLNWAARRLPPGALRAVHWLVTVFLVCMAVGFATSFSFLEDGVRLPAAPSEVAGAVGQTWFFASTAGYWLYCGFRLLCNRVWGRTHSPARRRMLNATGSALLAAPFAIGSYGALVERRSFRVREVDVPLGGLPADLDGLRILQISDIHLSAFLREQDLARVIDSANELKANLAVVTGDLISSRGDPLDACIRQIARLKSDAGTWGCMGNHERYARVESYTASASACAGVRFLRSQATPLRFGNSVLNLAGVDYQPLSSSRNYLAGANRLVTPGAVNVLLSHNPDVFPVAVHQGYNLLLAGHTHGGQVTVEILDQAINPARFFTAYVYGLYRRQSAAAYVTRGIGTIGIPARIGAPPEISILRLRKA